MDLESEHIIVDDTPKSNELLADDESNPVIPNQIYELVSLLAKDQANKDWQARREKITGTVKTRNKKTL